MVALCFACSAGFIFQGPAFFRAVAAVEGACWGA